MENIKNTLQYKEMRLVMKIQKLSRTPYDDENIKVSRTPFINNNNHHKENPHQDENADAPSQNFTIVGILYR